MFVPARVMKRIIAATTLAIAAWTTPVIAKECYAPDARAQERAFSRAVTTEGGKVVWLGGQTGSPNLNFEGQVREIFAELDKTISGQRAHHRQRFRAARNTDRDSGHGGDWRQISCATVPCALFLMLL